jgi:hypothetical protein
MDKALSYLTGPAVFTRSGWSPQIDQRRPGAVRGSAQIGFRIPEGGADLVHDRIRLVLRQIVIAGQRRAAQPVSRGRVSAADPAPVLDVAVHLPLAGVGIPSGSPPSAPGPASRCRSRRPRRSRFRNTRRLAGWPWPDRRSSPVPRTAACTGSCRTRNPAEPALTTGTYQSAVVTAASTQRREQRRLMEEALL